MLFIVTVIGTKQVKGSEVGEISIILLEEDEQVSPVGNEQERELILNYEGNVIFKLWKLFDAGTIEKVKDED